jgi:hypothetical protein
MLQYCLPARLLDNSPTSWSLLVVSVQYPFYFLLCYLCLPILVGSWMLSSVLSVNEITGPTAIGFLFSLLVGKDSNLQPHTHCYYVFFMWTRSRHQQQATCILYSFWRDNVFGLGVLMENKGEILYRNTGKRNCKIWCARIWGVSHVTPLLGNTECMPFILYCATINHCFTDWLWWSKK